MNEEGDDHLEGQTPSSDPPQPESAVPPQQPTSMPAIVHRSLSDTPLAACLQRHGFKVRVSETSSESSVIFPVSKVAFFYLHITPQVLTEWDSLQYRSHLLQRVTKFVQVHNNCYVILVTPYGLCDKTFAIIREIQTQHLNSKLQVIPSSNPAEAASAMVDIAKLQCRPLSEKLHGRFCTLMNKHLVEDTNTGLLNLLGLDSHHQKLVQDGIGSVSKLASSSVADLTDCALDDKTAVAIHAFFHHKSPTP